MCVFCVNKSRKIETESMTLIITSLSMLLTVIEHIYIYIYNTLVFKSHHQKNQNIANVCCSDYDYICLSSTFFKCKDGMFIYVKSKNHLPGYLDKNSQWRESLHHLPPTVTAIYPHIYTASKPRISSFANNTRHIKIFLRYDRSMQITLKKKI